MTSDSRFRSVRLVPFLMALGAASAFATDLPPAPALPPSPVFTWTGAYFGVNAGAAYDFLGAARLVPLSEANGGIESGARPASVRAFDTGAALGGQVGYNYELGGRAGGMVAGVEADLDYTGLDATRPYTGTGDVRSAFRAGLDDLGTVRARLGYAFGQFLVYGTGGLAYGSAFARDDLLAPGGSALRFHGSRSDTLVGYAAGGGVEYALPVESLFNVFHSSAITAKVEYIHYDLGDLATPATSATNAGGYGVRYRLDGDLARVGLNYKF